MNKTWKKLSKDNNERIETRQIGQVNNFEQNLKKVKQRRRQQQKTVIHKAGQWSVSHEPCYLTEWMNIVSFGHGVITKHTKVMFMYTVHQNCGNESWL